MKYSIIYKHVKNGYARMQSDGSVTITIPKLLRYNKKFESELLKQAEKMRVKYQKKEKINALTHEKLQLFWEEIKLNEIEISDYDLFFKETLLEYIEPLVKKYAKILGYTYSNIRIKKVKSKRWSCSHDQKLVFNQQLVHLPTRLILYVVVHEICHLKEKNHSAKFRKLVEAFLPEYKQYRKELRGLNIVSI